MMIAKRSRQWPPRRFRLGGHDAEAGKGVEEEMVNPGEDIPYVAVKDTGTAGASEEPRASPPGDKGDDHREVREPGVASATEASDKFSELDTFFIPRCLAF